MIDLTVVINLSFQADELSVAPGLTTGVIYDLMLGEAANFGSFAMQQSSVLNVMGLEQTPVSEYSHGQKFESSSSVLTPDSFNCTLSGNHPQFRIPFGVDGESKLAKENAKEEQIWT